MPEQFLGQRFAQAVEYALTHHATQWRKGTDIPYAAHILAVAARVLEMETGSEDEAIAALLHDVVEDGGGMAAAEEIRERFGADVERIVLACSDTTTEPKPPWRQRKEAYIASIATKQPDELRVSLADKVHNARAILLDYRIHGEALWARFKAGEGDSVRWYYRALAAAFDVRRDDLGPGGQVAVEELAGIVEQLDLEATTDEKPGHESAAQASLEAVPWTFDLVLKLLRVGPGADPDDVVTAAKQRIADRTLSPGAREVLAANGYPELGPEPDPDPDELVIVQMADGSSALWGPGERLIASWERDLGGAKVRAEARRWGLRD